MTARWDRLPEIRRLGLRLGEIVCDWHFEIRGTWLLVRSGFRFDGASIPLPFWPIIARPFSSWLQTAALIHDWFYEYNSEPFAQVMDGGAYRPITRYEADRIFLHVLVCEINRIFPGEGRWARYRRARRLVRARAMYRAVRSFAGPHWD
jgi:hypothetical protein